MNPDRLMHSFQVPLWGVASLADAIPEANEYKCIVFCLPYDPVAIAALPDGHLIDQCKKVLGEKTDLIYRAVREALPEHDFVTYDVVDTELRLRQRGVSQKVLGFLAGLGWIGRSSLLVTESFGPRVRLGTLFFRGDCEKRPARYESRCSGCEACVQACPASAISGNGYYVGKCRTIVTDASGNYKTFCGLCMQACPYGNARTGTQ